MVSEPPWVTPLSLTCLQGIVPTMIVVRVGLGISTQDITSYATNTARNNATRSGPTFALPMRFRQNTDVESTGYELESRGMAASASNDKMHGLDDPSPKESAST